MQHMKKKLLIFIFLITMINLSAQECEYTEYYPLVDSAFKNYSEKKYKEAEKNLKLAFNKTDFPLGKDLNLAYRRSGLRSWVLILPVTSIANFYTMLMS